MLPIVNCVNPLPQEPQVTINPCLPRAPAALVTALFAWCVTLFGSIYIHFRRPRWLIFKVCSASPYRTLFAERSASQESADFILAFIKFSKTHRRNFPVLPVDLHENAQIWKIGK